MALNIQYIGRETSQNLARNPTLTLASVVTVAAAITLLGVSLLVGRGVRDLSGSFQDDVQIVVFVQPAATSDQVEALGKALRDNPEVKHLSYVDKDASYKEALRLFADSPTIKEYLRKEDLPTSYRVKPHNPDLDAVQGLRALLEKQPGVYRVASASKTIKAIQEFSGKMRYGVLFAALVSAGTAILLIYNTIRTAMFARRREIEVMKLVGATNWFIRVPFIAEGIAQAILGGFLAALLMLGINRFLFSALAKDKDLEFFKNFAFSTGTVIGYSIPLVLVAMLIGALGSGFAVGRFLDV